MPGPGGTFSLTEADDHFPQTGSNDDNAGAEFIFALRGNDTVLAGAQADTVYGGIGDDELFGEAGDDFLIGDDGTDRIEGGSGADNITDQTGPLAFIDAGEGNDRVEIGSGFQTGSVLNGGAGFDVLLLGSATALTTIAVSGFEELSYAGAAGGVITGTARQFNGFSAFTNGNGEVPLDYFTLALVGLAGRTYTVNLFAELGLLPVLFTGSAGKDRLTGGRGNDTIYGDFGNDSIAGGKGKDDLHGGAGNDTLVGGLGRDTLTGGGDNDTYVFRSWLDARFGDTIVGWGVGQDRIDLAAIDAVIGGTDDDFSFVGTGPVSGSGGEVGYALAGGNTIVSVYLDGNTHADMRLVLVGEFTLTAESFVL